MAKKNNFIYGFLIFACVFVWVVMMGSKNVYVAEIEEIMSVFNVASKDTASFGMTLYFITYAVVQILLFFFLLFKFYLPPFSYLVSIRISPSRISSSRSITSWIAAARSLVSPTRSFNSSSFIIASSYSFV